MILSNRNGLKNTRNMLRVFGGLNETYSCTEAEYSAGINFSARNFPALSTRLPRRKLREEADLNGMYHLNGLLTVCSRDLVYTPDDTDEMEVTLKDAVENGRKTLVGIGTKILIFPDKLAFDTASRKVSALGAVWSGKNTSVEFAPCDAEGKVYEVSGCGPAEPDKPTDGQLFCGWKTRKSHGAARARWKYIVRRPATGRRWCWTTAASRQRGWGQTLRQRTL